MSTVICESHANNATPLWIPAGSSIVGPTGPTGPTGPAGPTGPSYNLTPVRVTGLTNSVGFVSIAGGAIDTLATYTFAPGTLPVGNNNLVSVTFDLVAGNLLGNTDQGMIIAGPGITSGANNFVTTYYVDPAWVWNTTAVVQTVTASCVTDNPGGTQTINIVASNVSAFPFEVEAVLREVSVTPLGN